MVSVLKLSPDEWWCSLGWLYHSLDTSGGEGLWMCRRVFVHLKLQRVLIKPQPPTRTWRHQERAEAGPRTFFTPYGTASTPFLLFLSQQPAWHPIVVTVETVLHLEVFVVEEKEKVLLLFVGPFSVWKRGRHFNGPHSRSFSTQTHLSGWRPPAVARQRTEVESNFAVKENWHFNTSNMLSSALLQLAALASHSISWDHLKTRQTHC